MVQWIFKKRHDDCNDDRTCQWSFQIPQILYLLRNIIWRMVYWHCHKYQNLDCAAKSYSQTINWTKIKLKQQKEKMFFGLKLGDTESYQHWLTNSDRSGNVQLEGPDHETLYSICISVWIRLAAADYHASRIAANPSNYLPKEPILSTRRKYLIRVIKDLEWEILPKQYSPFV